MRIVGRMGETGRQNLLARQSDRENSSWILDGSEPEVHPRRYCCAWLEDSRPVSTPEREEDANDRVTGEGTEGSSWRLRGEPSTAEGKLWYMLPRAWVTSCTA